MRNVVASCLSAAMLALTACGSGTTIGNAAGVPAAGSGGSITAAPAGAATPTPHGTTTPGSGATPAPGSSSAPAASATPSPSGTMGATSTDERNCLWTVDSTMINTLFPDTGATYWLANLPIPPNGSVRFDGVYPHARYLSFNVYNPLLQPTDSLTDFEIIPAAGSTNPFPAGANRNAVKRSYGISMVQQIAPSPPATRPDNMLYAGQTIGTLSASQNTAIVILRVYVPDRGLDTTGGAGLPHITFVTANGTQITGAQACTLPAVLDSVLPNLASIPDAVADVPVNTGAFENVLWEKFFDLQSSEATRVYNTPLGPAVYEQVGSPTTGGGGFASNADNRYISGTISETLGNVVAIHATFPKTPLTYDGRSPMGTGDMRYWSICSNDANTLVVYSCIYDEELVPDAQGRGVIAVSMPADRPANAITACGVTWLDWGTSATSLLIYRNMLAAPQTQFPEAIQYIPGPPGVNEASVMKQYYPYASHMMKGDFEALGCPVSADRLPSVVPSPPASS